jgi:hypothetical protein
MRTLTRTLVAFSLAAAAGCVGPVDTGTPDPDPIPQPSATARELFDTKVSPKLETSCASCHAGEGIPSKFMGAVGKSDNYATLTVNATLTGGWDPAAAQLLLHRHSGPGSELDATTKAGVREWLLKEGEDRADDPPMVTPREAMAKWAACMKEADWVETGMGSWAEKPSGSGACAACHSYGASGYFASRDTLEMFEMNRLESMIYFFFTVQQNGTENEVVVNLDRPCGRSQGGVTHPGYRCPDEYMDKLQAFYDKTKAGLANCTAPAAFPAPPAPMP